MNTNQGDFSWVDVKDGKELKPATKYIIPYHVAGDYKNARLYLCLYNPGVGEDVWDEKMIKV